MTAQELKNSILMRAVQGKLVPQDPADEPASVLLAKIRAEKEQMMKDGKMKKEPISEIYVDSSDNQHYEKIGKTVKCIEDEIPFEIPESWEWCRLSSLSSNIQYGYTASAQNFGNAKLLRITDIKDNIVDWNSVPYCDISNENLIKYKLNIRDIVIARTGGTIGKTYIVRDLDVLSVFASYLIRIVPIIGVNEEYLKIFMESPEYWRQLKEKSMGTGQPNINGKALGNLLIPLPPAIESIRIYHKLHIFSEPTKKYTDYYDKITSLDKEINVKLKQSLLQYAIQGKLVPQDPNDEPVSVLLEHIRTEKEQLIKEGKIKRDKNDSYIYRGSDNSYYEKFADGTITDINVPFEIPNTWEWVRLKHIGEIIGGGTPSTNVSEYWNGEIPWLTPADMKNIHSKFIIAGERNITELGLNKSSAKLLEKYSILYSSRAPIGYIGIAQNSMTTNQGFKSVSLYIKNMHMYLYYTLIQRTDDIKARATGTTFKEISGAEFGNTLIPLPPIQEQYRIINYLEQMYNLL